MPGVDLARWRWLCALYSIASGLIGKHMVSIWTLPTIYTQELLAQKPPRPPRPLDNPKGRAQWYLLGNSQQTSHAKARGASHYHQSAAKQERWVLLHSFDKGPIIPIMDNWQEPRPSKHSSPAITLYKHFLIASESNLCTSNNPTVSIGFKHIWTKNAHRLQHRHVIEVYGE